MTRATHLPARIRQRSSSMAEVETLAWLLDNSIPVPFLGGRRFGVDAIVGLIPGFGDLASTGLGLIVVWRASRMGFPKIVVARMLMNTGIDLVVGAIPFLGDVFDLWFKSNARNLGLAQQWLERPDRSTRGEWLAILLIVAILVGMIAFVLWVIAGVMSWIAGLF
jgi:Domain of unknown function (DUF4112)